MMLLHNGTIITVDRQRRIISDGAIVIHGDRIIAVGKSSEVLAQFPAEEHTDLKSKIVIPGLVDTHVHLAQALIRECADDMALIPWLCDRVWVLQGNFTAEDGQTSAALCIAEMLKSGTTTFVESMLAGRYGFDGIAEVVRASGIRACLSKIVMDISTYATQQNAMYPGMIEDRETTMRETLEMYDKWNGQADGRIRVWFGPRTPGGVTPDLYREMVTEARKRGMGMTMHLAEVEADKRYLAETYGMTPVDFAESVGLLGSDVVLVHMVWLTQPEIEKLAATKTNVSHNPSSNSKLASGVCKVPQMLAAGVNVGLGCDGGPSNNAYDLINEMKIAAIIHKAVTLDPLVVPAETVLEMATINGARAVGMADAIGSLEVGKKADLVVLRIDEPHMTPGINPISNLVYAATGADVTTVMVDGRVVVQDGQLVTMDEAAIIAHARQRAKALYERAGVTIVPRWPIL
jgi:cytosine/adenosine deaminase-related metal-dependent hydrolase